MPRIFDYKLNISDTSTTDGETNVIAIPLREVLYWSSTFSFSAMVGALYVISQYEEDSEMLFMNQLNMAILGMNTVFMVLAAEGIEDTQAIKIQLQRDALKDEERRELEVNISEELVRLRNVVDALLEPCDLRQIWSSSCISLKDLRIANLFDKGITLEDCFIIIPCLSKLISSAHVHFLLDLEKVYEAAAVADKVTFDSLSSDINLYILKITNSWRKNIELLKNVLRVINHYHDIEDNLASKYRGYPKMEAFFKDLLTEYPYIYKRFDDLPYVPLIFSEQLALLSGVDFDEMIEELRSLLPELHGSVTFEKMTNEEVLTQEQIHQRISEIYQQAFSEKENHELIVADSRAPSLDSDEAFQVEVQQSREENSYWSNFTGILQFLGILQQEQNTLESDRVASASDVEDVEDLSMFGDLSEEDLGEDNIGKERDKGSLKL